MIDWKTGSKLSDARLGRLVGVLLLVVAGSSLGGCVTAKSPVVAIHGGAVTGMTDEAVEIAFDVELSNANVEPQELEIFTYAVSIDGRRVYSGKRSAEATLAGSATKLIQLPAVIRFDQVAWDASSMPATVRYSINGELVYLTPGAIEEILFDAGVRTPSVGFRSKGDMSMLLSDDGIRIPPQPQDDDTDVGG